MLAFDALGELFDYGHEAFELLDVDHCSISFRLCEVGREGGAGGRTWTDAHCPELREDERRDGFAVDFEAHGFLHRERRHHHCRLLRPNLR